jgi:hypothetical protein
MVYHFLNTPGCFLQLSLWWSCLPYLEFLPTPPPTSSLGQFLFTLSQFSISWKISLNKLFHRLGKASFPCAPCAYFYHCYRNFIYSHLSFPLKCEFFRWGTVSWTSISPVLTKILAQNNHTNCNPCYQIPTAGFVSCNTASLFHLFFLSQIRLGLK